MILGVSFVGKSVAKGDSAAIVFMLKTCSEAAVTVSVEVKPACVKP